MLYSTVSLQSAEAGSDYTAILGKELTLAEGISTANISVAILADTLPELNETFQLVLNDVNRETDVDESEDPAGPELGAITTVDVVILENDDPYGRFHITGSGGESVVEVQEVASLGVQLVVERQGGRVGTVQVSWGISGGSATEGDDFGG